MDRKRKIIWCVILGLVIGGVTLSLPQKKNKNGSKLIHSSTGGVSNKVVGPSPGNNKDMEKKKERVLEWVRDPFVFGDGALESGGIRITGIIFDESDVEHSYAIIEGQLIRIGEQINGAKLVKVNKKSVVIEVNGGQEELFLRPEEE